MGRYIFGKWSLIPVILLFFTIIYKLINLLVITNKSFDQFIGDFCIAIPRLYFLTQYNFYETVPLWFNGYVLFKLYPPGWYYFTLPFFYLTKNVFIATYISIIILFVLAFLLVYLFGKQQGLQRNEILLFYGLLFGNALFLTSITDGGRVADLFSWNILISLAILIFHYKKNKINGYFIIFTFLVSLLLLAHIYFFIVGFILILCLFFYKSFKEKIIIILCMILSLFITSFWWIGFLNFVIQENKNYFKMLYELINLSSVISLNTLALLSFLIFFFFYIKNTKNKKKEFLFFLPVVTVAVLMLTRILILFPIFNNVPASAYNFLYTFLSLFLFFKLCQGVFFLKLKYLIIFLMIIISLINIPLLHRFNKQPWAEYDTIRKEILQTFEVINGKYIILVGNKDWDIKHVVSYATIYYNLSTVHGNDPHEEIRILKEVEYLNRLLIENDCNLLKERLNLLGVSYIISIEDNCFLLKNCGFKELQQKKYTCTYKARLS